MRANTGGFVWKAGPRWSPCSGGRPRSRGEREIIFYRACPAETTSAREARRFRSYGFTDTKALRGGVGAWKKAGYLMVGAYCLTR
jgi:rhodanese-related sulfurtransferase